MFDSSPLCVVHPEFVGEIDGRVYVLAAIHSRMITFRKRNDGLISLSVPDAAMATDAAGKATDADVGVAVTVAINEKGKLNFQNAATNRAPGAW